MKTIHVLTGLILAGIFLLVFVWGLIAWIRNRDPGVWFWRLLGIGQIGILLMAITGITLFLMGGRRPWLHYSYGIFPALVLIFSHRQASKRFSSLPWAVFSLAGLVIFGLLVRGYMTGHGA